MSGKARKPGVASDAEMASFLAAFPAEEVVVVDARDVDCDADSVTLGALAGTGYRGPRSVNLPYDRSRKLVDLAPLEPLLVRGKETPIITHCGGGGRGQKTKDFLLANGFANVINGGGPSVGELWEKFGKL